MNESLSLLQTNFLGSKNRAIFFRLIFFACFVIAFAFWSFSYLRHFLLHTNAYDLGLFDQWIWLASKGLPPYSSMEGVHLLADHGAWLLYLATIPYRLNASVHWLLTSQALALSFTAIPLVCIALQAGLNRKLCWLVSGLWWLQPVVFNVNLFDFHPEVWAMPLLGFSYYFCRANKPWLWFFLLFLSLGSRDGLVLVVIGIGLEQALRKRWLWAIAAIGLSLGWLAYLNKFLYPSLTGFYTGPKAVSGLFSYLGNTFDEVVINLITRPYLLIENVDWAGGLIYILLISIAIFPFFRFSSLTTAIGALPLIIVNFLSEEAPQRTLIHHYSLPIALIFIVVVIDSLSINRSQTFPWKKLVWSSICWAALAKPWFFTGPYLSRIHDIPYVYQAINLVPEEANVYTTSYLIPHLSHRKIINFPRSNKFSNKIDLLLLNPKDPGWGSDNTTQEQLLFEAKERDWKCISWPNGLELCQKPLPSRR